MRHRIAVVCVILGALAALAAQAAAASGVTLTAVGRVPFPYRSFVVDLQNEVPLGDLRPDVTENGKPVHDATLEPVSSTELRFGTLLAIDASDSMRGKPEAAALEAARAFISRRPANEQVGVVTFNSRVTVLQPLTARAGVLASALDHAPPLAYGTHIYDGLARSLELLERARIAPASIVLLSDGADLGSTSTFEKVVDNAQRNHVRIFTVGLRSGAFDAAPLRALSSPTGATYAEAASAPALARIYGALSGRLASEYLLSYTSKVDPGTHVGVTVRLADIGTGGTSYVAPRPSGLKPFHQSPLERFFLSAGSVLVLVLLAAAIVGWLCWTILTRPRRSVVDRVAEFVGAHRADEAPVEKTAQPRHLARRATSTGARTRMARLDQQFEIGQIGISATFFVVATAAATAVSFILLAAIALPLCVIAILVPLAARSWAQRKVQGVRSDFADQLPETLQLLASALRSGHSLIGALNVVVDGAPDPMKGEFSRVLTDDQLGLPIDQSLRKVADRMKSRDMQQVGLLGELQRTAGGNSAEVLDAVVATVRERAEVRGLVRTLTAQGRMSRWILSFMPVVLGAIMFLGAPDLMKPMLTSGGGQIALVAAAMLAGVGSLWIKKITEIEV